MNGVPLNRRTSSTCIGLACAAALLIPTTASATPIQVRASLAQPSVLAGTSHRAWLRVGLRGHRSNRRAPLNVAIVLDKSSSMAGAKIREARRAAIETVRRLRSHDIVSVVTYDSVVQVVVPATRATDKRSIMNAIARVEPGGYTALFAGVAKGAAELRKFRRHNRVNRVVLLSDGLANRGPSSPGELARLGASLAREGMSVSTIGLGLGYNEDLMSRLASASDGNHAFVEEAADLARIFDFEFGDLFSVVAQDVDVVIDCAPGVRPLRVLGRDASIHGRKVRTRLAQVYGGQEKYVLIEVELPAMARGLASNVAAVDVAFLGMEGSRRRHQRANVGVQATDSMAEVERNTRTEVMVAVAEMQANERNKLALAVRDRGDLEQARKLLQANTRKLQKQAKQYKSKRLDRLHTINKDNAANLEEKAWRKTRKQMRKTQYEFDNQQSY